MHAFLQVKLHYFNNWPFCCCNAIRNNHATVYLSILEHLSAQTPHTPKRKKLSGRFTAMLPEYCFDYFGMVLLSAVIIFYRLMYA